MLNPIQRTLCHVIRGVLLLSIAVWIVHADSTSILTGRVVDPAGRTVPNAEILVRNVATLVERAVMTNNEGIYEIPALPVGVYRMQVKAPGFRLYTVESLTTDVARTLVQDVRLELGDISQEVTVTSQPALIDGATTSVGHVIGGRTVQEVPLNGRYFLDLAMLAPGSVTASAERILDYAQPRFGGAGDQHRRQPRGDGQLPDQRHHTQQPGFQLHSFQPSISTIQEFKIDNSTFSAEYGQSSGAIVNMATRSGSSEFHGELFEFFRNNALDARNFFNFTSSEPPPFKRNQFGGNLGGPIVRSKTFFFFSYEGLRQAQGLNLNSLVLSDAQRASVTDAVIAKLIELIPRPNFIDSSGAPRFIGSAPAPVDIDQWGLDISHILSEKDRLHGYYSFNHTKTRRAQLCW